MRAFTNYAVIVVFSLVAALTSYVLLSSNASWQQIIAATVVLRTNSSTFWTTNKGGREGGGSRSKLSSLGSRSSSSAQQEHQLYANESSSSLSADIVHQVHRDCYSLNGTYSISRCRGGVTNLSERTLDNPLGGPESPLTDDGLSSYRRYGKDPIKSHGSTAANNNKVSSQMTVVLGAQMIASSSDNPKQKGEQDGNHDRRNKQSNTTMKLSTNNPLSTKSDKQFFKLKYDSLKDVSSQTSSQTSLLVPPPACSCWNATYSCKAGNSSCWKQSDVCCTRRVYCSHKMGYVLSRGLFRLDYTGVRLKSNPPRITKNFFDTNESYRHREVLIVRDFVSSIISGYLYHRAGRECQYDEYGKQESRGGKNLTYYLHGLPWEDMLKQKLPDLTWKRITTPPKPAMGRDLCQYLAQESEEVGLTVFIDFSLGTWYDRVYKFGKAVLERQQQQQQRENIDDPQKYDYPPPRTLLICHDEFVNVTRLRATFQKIMHWLHPTGYDLPETLDPTLKLMKKDYSGHATSHDQDLRSRLAGIVHKLDREVFNNWLSKANNLFGCR